MTKMNEISFHQYGEPAVLQKQSSDIPSPGRDEILIRIRAAGVNFSDVLRRRNTYFMPTPLPFVPGAEAAGTIEKIGEGVEECTLEIGQRILAILPFGGGYAEYAVAPAEYCVPLPQNISDSEATAVFVQGTTAWLMIHQAYGQVLSGKSVLVHAAAGGVGSLLVQLAKQAGATVIGATGTSSKMTTIEELGADVAVLSSTPGWPDSVIKGNQGQPVDLIFEMGGGNLYEESFQCLNQGGTMIVYGAASGQKGFMHSELFVDACQTVKGFNLAYYVQHRTTDWQEALGAVIGLMASNKLSIKTPNTYPLAKAATAHQALESRKTTGKVVPYPVINRKAPGEV